MLMNQQDVPPNLSNRLVAPLATRISVAFADSLAYFPARKTLQLGNPLRQAMLDVRQTPPQEARRALGFERQEPLLLVTGGSQGARHLNQTVGKALPDLLAHCQVLQISGNALYNETRELCESALAAQDGVVRRRYRLVAYLNEEMPLALQAADLVLCRSGASTLSELAALGKPSILVPLPPAIGSSPQEANAEMFGRNQAARVMKDGDLKPQVLVENVTSILASSTLLEAMSNAASSFAKPQATQEVAALDPGNPELVAAKARGMQVMTWQEMLGRWMLGKCVLSVSGVHGKGTTTAMLALMLVHAGLDPSCEIGAIVPEFGTNYRIGKSQYFVNEADEFNNNFWHYHPRLAIVTSIEFEHPEFFADYPALLGAFEHFIRGMDMQGDWPFPPVLVLNADSPGCLELREWLHDWPGHITSYSVEETSSRGVEHKEPATFVAYDVKLAGETSFRVRLQEQDGQAFLEDKVIHLQIPGIHNIQNALAALAAAHT